MRRAPPGALCALCLATEQTHEEPVLHSGIKQTMAANAKRNHRHESKTIIIIITAGMPLSCGMACYTALLWLLLTNTPADVKDLVGYSCPYESAPEILRPRETWRREMGKQEKLFLQIFRIKFPGGGCCCSPASVHFICGNYSAIFNRFLPFCLQRLLCRPLLEHAGHCSGCPA